MPPIPPARPKTMRGVQMHQTGDVSVLTYQTNLPIPTPEASQVLIRNTYIGINYIDTYIRTGLYPSALPCTPGCEASGIIAGLGPGSEQQQQTSYYGLQPGDRVVYLSDNNGCYAEYTCTAALRVVKIPSGMDEVVAAAAFIQGLTALTLIREAHEVKREEWVLVHAAAGGCGLWLCRLLKGLVGARVIGTVGSEDKKVLARSYGAEVVVDYRKEDVVGRVGEITGGEGVGVVFDGVGRDTFDADLEVLARKGSLVSFGNASGDVPPFHIRRLAAKNLKLVRPRLHGYIATREEVEKYAGELFRFMMGENNNEGEGGKKLDVHIHHVYPLEDVRRAHEDLEGRKTTGKLLLKP